MNEAEKFIASINRHAANTHTARYDIESVEINKEVVADVRRAMGLFLAQLYKHPKLNGDLAAAADLVLLDVVVSMVTYLQLAALQRNKREDSTDDVYRLIYANVERSFHEGVATYASLKAKGQID